MKAGCAAHGSVVDECSEGGFWSELRVAGSQQNWHVSGKLTQARKKNFVLETLKRFI